MKFIYKITAAMVCLLSFILGISGSLLISISFNDSLKREKETASNSYKMVMNTLYVVNSIDTKYSNAGISKTLDQIYVQNPVWSALRLKSSDSIIYENGAASASLNGNIVHEYEDSLLVSFFKDDDGKNYLQLSGSLIVSDRTLYLDMAYDISPIFASKELMQKSYQRIFIIMVIVCAFISYAIAWVLTRSLIRLSRAAKEIADGNLSYRLRKSSNDEIGMLTMDFNTMADKLENSFADLTNAMDRQERFMGSFAHELKTPMTSIIGYADLLRSQALDYNEQADAANYIFSEGKRLENLSLKLLDILVMGNKEVSFSPESPAGIISNLVEYLKPIFGKSGIYLQYKCENGVCLMEPDLIRSMLINLMDNSRKAMDEGGNIFVNSVMTPDGCEIQIIDNGRGIPDDAMEHLTEAFYRVDKSRSRMQGGAGLGLSLCNEIVKLHKGDMRFESRIGNGTCVTVVLRGGRM